MDYIEIYKLTENNDEIAERLLGYIGKDGKKVIIKNITKDIDLKMFDRTICKRLSKDDGKKIIEICEPLKSSHKEWLKYLGSNLDEDFFASEIKTANKLP